MLLLSSFALIDQPAWAQNPFRNLIKPGDLIEGHAELEEECALCHARFKRDNQSMQCRDCHEKIDNDIKEELGFHGRSLEVTTQPCSACHTDHEGRDARVVNLNPTTFEHSLTNFPLLGGHRGQECKTCHEEGVKHRETPTACSSCHAEDDKHHGEFGKECLDCHTQLSWTEARFDHSETGWPLLGEHSSVSCNSCHTTDSYTNAPTECFACHKSDDEHKGHFGRQCDSCHSVEGWGRVSFNHESVTGFALEGGHLKSSCNQCHTEPVFEVALQTTCESCHLEDDVHEGIRGDQCATCHSVSDWNDTNFDHFQLSGFQLRGKHSSLDCGGCHLEPAGTVTLPQTCNECHTSDDPHKQQLGTSCENCHREDSWIDDVIFDHSLTVFPLLGKHAKVECSACHETKAYKDVSSECSACHKDDDYHDGSLGQSCDDCHSTQGWEHWTFDHAVTGYALTGGHEAVACNACHSTPGGTHIAQPPQKCVACHASDDVHAGDFGRQCGRCHTTSSFSQPKVMN